MCNWLIMHSRSSVQLDQTWVIWSEHVWLHLVLYGRSCQDRKIQTKWTSFIRIYYNGAMNIDFFADTSTRGLYFWWGVATYLCHSGYPSSRPHTCTPLRCDHILLSYTDIILYISNLVGVREVSDQKAKVRAGVIGKISRVRYQDGKRSHGSEQRKRSVLGLRNWCFMLRSDDMMNWTGYVQMELIPRTHALN